MTARAVFLDRDGVINLAPVVSGLPKSPMNVDELEIDKDAAKSVRDLRHLGFLIFVVTNQPEIARGNLSLSNMQAINEMISKQIEIDEIKFCPHDDGDHCHCRKPQPGMILELAKKYSVDLDRSFMIGDRKKDMEAAFSAGVKAIQIDRGYSEGVSNRAIAISSSLPSAVRVIKRLEGSKLWRMYCSKSK